MEVKARIRGCWFQKMVIFSVLGLFIMAKAEAQLLAPVVSVSPSSTNVSNGDTVTLNASAYTALGLLSSITWQFNGGSTFPTNVTFTTSGGILNVNSSINATLTISNFSSACVGTYTCVASSTLIFSGSASAKLGIVPTITPVTGGSGMATNGFKVAFNAPTGSNVVIEASSDLKTWVPIWTNVVTSGTVSCTDTNAKAHPSRYYRAHTK